MMMQDTNRDDIMSKAYCEAYLVCFLTLVLARRERHHNTSLLHVSDPTFDIVVCLVRINSGHQLPSFEL